MKKTFVLLSIIFLLGITNVFAYSDVDENHWAYKTIENLKRQEIVFGYPDGNFYPENKVKRCEFISLLQRIVIPGDIISISSGHWAEECLKLLEEKKIIITNEYSKFDFEEEVTRGEIAKILVRAFEGTKQAYLRNDNFENTFSDISEENQERIKIAQILKNVNVLRGYPDNTVRFEKKITRAELSIWINKVIEQREQLEKFNLEKGNIYYENGVATYNGTQMYPTLQPLQFSDDHEYITTKIENIEVFEFSKEYKGKYEKIVQEIYKNKDLYSKYRRKFAEGNTVVAIEFATKNNCTDYDIFTGYRYLHISFPHSEDVGILDSFDTDELYMQKLENPFVAVTVVPGEEHKSIAFYVLDKYPKEKIRLDRAATTVYDSKRKEYKEIGSFFAAVIKI